MKKSFKKLINTTLALLLLVTVILPNNSVKITDNSNVISTCNIVDEEEIN